MCLRSICTAIKRLVDCIQKFTWVKDDIHRASHPMVICHVREHLTHALAEACRQVGCVCITLGHCHTLRASNPYSDLYLSTSSCTCSVTRQKVDLARSRMPSTPLLTAKHCCVLLMKLVLDDLTSCKRETRCAHFTGRCLVGHAAHQKRKESTTPFGVNSQRS